MSALFDSLCAAGAFAPIDVELALVLGDLVGDDRDEVLLGVAVASRATREGHVCADLARVAGKASSTAGDGLTTPTLPELAEWRRVLAGSELVSDGSIETPLVLDPENRLYLRRHWEDERRLGDALRRRAAKAVNPADPAELRRLLRRLFGEASNQGVDFQRLAAEVAAVSAFTVVAGGPGTGKTWTVTKIVALAIADCMARGREKPTVLLLAPTGKAAARLAESTARAKKTLDCPEAILACIPDEARTVHRALGKGHAPRSFRHGAGRPLAADVVVLDEASMVDLFVMRHLVESVPESARLILLGDRSQLSSVEAGAVLADISGEPAAARYSEELSLRLGRTFQEPLPPSLVVRKTGSIDDAVVTLTAGHRFAGESPVGELSRAIERGDEEGVLRMLSGKTPDLVLLSPGKNRDESSRLKGLLREGFTPLATSATPEEALERLERFRVLSAHRRGPLGVEDMNRRIEELLGTTRLTRAASGFTRPILVDRNDPSLDLYNGDVGVLFRETRLAAPRAMFRTADGAIRTLSPARLPPHEPAFAMSVHKSQGSEFDEVVVVLPNEASPLLSRELFYTAVTRARRRVTVHASAASIREAVRRRVVRTSGLASALRTS